MNEPAALQVVNQDIEVCAETPDEMKAANQELIGWCERKINQMRVEQIELESALDVAVAKGWKASVLNRHVHRAKKRVEFYGKIKKALEHGYYIVPSFPVTLFAIRSDDKAPAKLVTTYRSSSHEQKALTLPEGKGAYKNPLPVIYQRDVTQPGVEKKTIEYFAESWKELDFPVNMAKPRIMEATDRAMAIKIFDDFGVLPSPTRKVDPLIVARIKDPRSTTYSQRFVSFIIAWALDTKTL